MYICIRWIVVGWLRLVGSLKLQVSFAKEPYKRDKILQKRPMILRSLLIVATPYELLHILYIHTILLVFTCLFCKRALLNRLYSAKQTYNFKEPTHIHTILLVLELQWHIITYMCVQWIILRY